MLKGNKHARFPILFATDIGYVRHLAAALYSLLENNPSLTLEIFVITSAMPNYDRNFLTQICESFNTPIKFLQLDDSCFDGLILNHHFKKSNYYRLFADELINADKCLYLDADIIVQGSISELVNTDLQETYLAAVENPGFRRHLELGMKQESRYFNSGVMLLNLRKLRSVGIKERVVAFVRENREAIHFVDQCGLNGIVDGDWIILDERYNFQSSMLTGSEDRIKFVVPDPVIIHFTGSSKPWQLNNKHPFKKLYWHYRNKTPYKSHFPDDLSISQIVRYFFSLRKIKAILGRC